MPELPCKELGCTLCCQWGNQVDLIKPTVELDTHPNGDCRYLIRGIGCILFNNPMRPLECVTFSCQEFLERVESNETTKPMTAVIVGAVKMREFLRKDKVT